MFSPLSYIKSALIRNSINVPGFRTSKKIVVIESDDWGSIRMPSVETYSRFISNDLDISGSDYNRLDSLECNEDLQHIYEVLLSLKDKYGNHPVITANCVVGNPDFRKIRQSDFEEYFFEPVTQTLTRYPHRDNVLNLWIQGYSSGIFHPQFHGREHVNVARWMAALKKRTPDIMFTFDNETTFSGKGDYNFMEVLDYNTPDDLLKMKESLAEGLDLFERIFGYRSKSFIPPCYTWDSEIEKTLYENGIKYIQGLYTQAIPTGSFGNYRKKYHFCGNRNRLGQYYLVRNCIFEPSLTKLTDPVGACLDQINIAFRWHKPAIIGSHRLNYIGSLVEKNRTDNLNQLHDLLKLILRRWPDVVFMTSDKLGDLITESTNNE